MRAILVRAYGTADALEPVERPDPVPGPGQVLIRSAAIGVNFADTQMRAGSYSPALTPPLPFTPGLEASGHVEVVGEGVAGLAPGQAVLAWTLAGTYAERFVADAATVTALPPGVDLHDAAALWINYATAWHVLHTLGGVREGETVLVRAAAGGVGLAALQLARRAGARVVGVVSRPEKAAAVLERGAWAAVDASHDDVPARVAALTAGRGVDLVLESVGAGAFEQDFGLLAAFGRVVWFGAAGGPIRADLLALMRAAAAKSPTAALFNLHALKARPGGFAETARTLLELLAQGAIRPAIEARLPLAEAREAHRRLESRASVGKLLLLP